MSYRPSGPDRGYTSSSGPSNYNVSGVRVRRKGGGNVPWLAGCGLLFLGVFIGVVGLFLAALFWFGSPVSNQPLPRRDTGTAADLSATLSEGYLNAAFTKYLKENPVNLSGIATVKDATLEILPNQQIKASLRLGNAAVDFDVIVTEAVGVKDGKIQLQPVGQPQVGKGNLPVGTDRLVELINTTLIEPELNRNFTQLQVSSSKFRLLDVSTAAKAITVRYNAQ